MYGRLLAWGFAGWLVATVALRLAGQHVLHPKSAARSLVLLALSALFMAWLTRALCRRAGLARSYWPVGAVVLLLPMLLLDPLSCVFFPWVFPNIPAQAAGVFGGWMLSCCAGGLLGAVVGQPRPS